VTEIVLEQRIAAPPSTVYRFLTESEKWKLWQGVDAKLDARVGGIFSMFMGNGMAARGQFVELVPDRRVVFTWGWVDRPGIPPGSTTVEIELNAEGEGPGWFSPTARFLRAKQLPRRWVGATTFPGWPWWQRAGYPVSTRARASPT
jgi:uncharacterized protein YndB with AHSA1/START domain